MKLNQYSANIGPAIKKIIYGEEMIKESGVIQHFIFKKIFDPIYFNKKYYSDYELSIFNSFPLFLIKTLGYIKAIVFPHTMRRKFEQNILDPKERPVTYQLAWITMITIICYGVILINTVIMGILFYSYN